MGQGRALQCATSKDGWTTEDIMMCRLKGKMDKRGHYDVEMKGCMQKGCIMMCKLKGGWIREGIMMWK